VWLRLLADRVHAHARTILVCAAVGAVLAAAFGANVAERLGPYSANDPATESVQARHRFERAAGRQLDAGVVALVQVGGAERVARRLARAPGIARVLTYRETDDAAMLSRDGRSTYVLAFFEPLADERISADTKRIQAEFAHEPGVELGGPAIANREVVSQVRKDLERAELIVFPFIFALSLLFFRSLVAALLPPLLGGIAIVVTFALLRLVDSALDLSIVALNLVTGAGLGLTIDYSLFVVSRYREEAAVAGFGEVALRRTLETAGRTISYSAVTVAVTLASLTIFPQRFLYSMGIGGSLVAVLAAAIALVVLPALLAVLGPRVNALAPAWLQRAAAHDARIDEAGGWYRLSRFVMRRPARIALVTGTLLVAAGIPCTAIRFTTIDASTLPVSASARRVDDALHRRFAVGNRSEPLQVVAALPATSPRVEELRHTIARLPDVAAVSAPQPAGRTATLLQVAPAERPLSERSKQLVHRVRALAADFPIAVAGTTASFIDFQHSLALHVPFVIAIAIAATAAVLFLMTGSVVLPIKAVLMNALSLSATFGILVFIFQEGRLERLLSYSSQGALETSQPILLFAVAFGLATDYGVFLLSRIKEARDQGARTNADAVAIGLERTGRIVTAAALLFAVAIGAFVTSQVVFVKEMALGTALAVLIDASIIRALLVPSLMALLGSWNWWAPRPLRRLHNRVALREDARAMAVEVERSG
jgi:RND superfamily putative drug exporter